jgi:hypothetical protein
MSQYRKPEKALAFSAWLDRHSVFSTLAVVTVVVGFVGLLATSMAAMAVPNKPNVPDDSPEMVLYRTNPVVVVGKAVGAISAITSFTGVVLLAGFSFAATRAYQHNAPWRDVHGSVKAALERVVQRVGWGCRTQSKEGLTHIKMDENLFALRVVAATAEGLELAILPALGKEKLVWAVLEDLYREQPFNKTDAGAGLKAVVSLFTINRLKLTVKEPVGEFFKLTIEYGSQAPSRVVEWENLLKTV